MGLDSGDDGVDAAEHGPRFCGIGNLQPIVFIQRDDQLQRIHGIQAKAAWTKKRLIITNFFRFDLKHEIVHQHAFDFGLKHFCVRHVQSDFLS